MRLVYMCTPISDGGMLDHQSRWDNVNRAIAAYVRLVEAGYWPYCPALTQLVDDKYPGQISYEQWMDISYAWLDKADCVFRVPGPSDGCNCEEMHAKLRGIPVFHMFEDLENWNMNAPAAPIEQQVPTSDQFPQIPTVLDEAAKLVEGDRRRDYDHPLPNHQRIGKMWGVQLENYVRYSEPGDPVPPRTVALCMIGLKLAREAFTPRRDNITDIVGYSRCVELIDECELK